MDWLQQLPRTPAIITNTKYQCARNKKIPRQSIRESLQKSKDYFLVVLDNVCLQQFISLQDFLLAFSKDPGIPNLCRYKAQLRAQVEGHQQRLQQQKDQQKEKRNKAQQKQRAGQEQPSCADLSELRTRADERGRAFAEKDTAGEAEDIFIREMAGKHSKGL